MPYLLSARWFKPVFFLSCLLSSFSLAVQAEVINKDKLVASYLYNFSKNIEWPNEAAKASFDIAVYGSDYQALYAELAVLRNNIKLRNMPITVSQINNVKALADFDLVYVGNVSSSNLEVLVNAIVGRAVLLVTEGSNNKQLVMINLVATDQERLRFEVNSSNIINHNLTPLPELILNGGSEIDVAKLYREGQASLVELQQQLAARENLLTQLTATINEQKIFTGALEKQLQSLRVDIDQSDKLIDQQRVQLLEQRESIEESNRERLRLQQDVKVRTQELHRQQLELNKIAVTIDGREKRLAELNQTIGLQEQEISEQKNAIVNLDAVVGTQQVALNYLWGLVILGVLLLASILIAYVIKQRANRRLAAQTKELQIAKDRLAIAKRQAEEASQAKGDFLSLMSHELRTPLQSIIGYTEVVIEELRLDDDEHHVQDLLRVISNGERLLKLINGVLDLAKVESGQMTVDLTEVKLTSLVDEALDNLLPLFEKNEIQLSVHVQDGSFLPRADPEKLVHILINLLGNACKFAKGGEVELRVSHEPEKIFIAVRDTGIGLSLDQQRHIFDPFLQVDATSTRRFQGSGLGLSITRQFCEMMGGSIRVESTLGAGAAFIVELPLPIVPAVRVSVRPAVPA
jgi:signal transduction histidine kinase